jgi:hypothetical protein
MLLVSPVVASAGLSACGWLKVIGHDKGAVSELFRDLCEIEIWLASSEVPDPGGDEWW